MIQWEYKVVVLSFKTEYSYPSDSLEIHFLTDLGNKGWELCCVLPDKFEGRPYYFKRQITESE